MNANDNKEKILEELLSKSSLPKCKKTNDLNYSYKWNNCIGIAKGRKDGHFPGTYIGEFVDGSFQGYGMLFSDKNDIPEYLKMYVGQFFDDEPVVTMPYITQPKKDKKPSKKGKWFLVCTDDDWKAERC